MEDQNSSSTQIYSAVSFASGPQKQGVSPMEGPGSHWGRYQRILPNLPRDVASLMWVLGGFGRVMAQQTGVTLPWRNWRVKPLSSCQPGWSMETQLGIACICMGGSDQQLILPKNLTFLSLQCEDSSTEMQSITQAEFINWLHVSTKFSHKDAHWFIPSHMKQTQYQPLWIWFMTRVLLNHFISWTVVESEKIGLGCSLWVWTDAKYKVSKFKARR